MWILLGINIDWPNGLCEKFLDINPRPTIEELKQVLSPPGGLWLTSQNQFTRRGVVPDPDRPGWMEIRQGRIFKNPEARGTKAY